MSLTIHQPSSRIQLLLDHLTILARGQLMYHQGQDPAGKGSSRIRMYLQTGAPKDKDFDNSVRTPWNQSRPWSASQSGIIQTLRFTPSSQRTDNKAHNPMRSSPSY